MQHSTTTQPTPEAASRRPSELISGIQGLRAVAIILVVVYHLGLPFGAGFIGVDVFFVISGFVITRMVLRRSASTNRLSLGAFWGGRVRRLLPALAVTVVLTVIGAALFTSPIRGQSGTGITGIAASLWSSNGYLAFMGAGYFSKGGLANPLMHTWSLAVEEQFYVFFPLLMAVLLWWTRRRGGTITRRLAIWLSIVGILSLALCIWLTFVRLPLPVGWLIAFYSPLTRAWEFAAGALVAIALHRGWVPGAWARVSAVLGGIVLVIGLAVIEAGSNFPGWFAILPVVASVLLIIAAVSGAPGASLLSTRPMVFIGDVSYGWYLFHWPLIVFAASALGSEDFSLPVALLVGAAGFGAAVLCYRWIEQPIRERRVFGRLRAPFLMVLVLVPSIAASYALLAMSGRGWGVAEVKSMQAQLDHGRWHYQAVCQSTLLIPDRDMSACQFPGDAGKRPLILVGDSNAGVYAELMVELGKETGRPVSIATVPSCPLVDVESIQPDGRSWLDCQASYDATMEWLGEQPPSTVVVASGGVAVDTKGYTMQLADGSIVRPSAARGAALQASLERSYAAVRERGHSVVQVELAPHFAWWPSNCSLLEMLRDGTPSCGETSTRAEADDFERYSLAAERAASSAANVPVIAIRDLLCPEAVCRTNVGNRWIYEDGTHLSYDAALGLLPTFSAVLSGEGASVK